jgi:hypothetical protein
VASGSRWPRRRAAAARDAAPRRPGRGRRPRRPRSRTCRHRHSAACPSARRSPLACYKAGLKAVKAFARGNDTDADALAALQQCASALAARHAGLGALAAGWDAPDAPPGLLDAPPPGDANGSGGGDDSPGAAVAHSFDLGLDEPGYLLAAALLALARLREARGELGRAAVAAAAALRVFPAFIAARGLVARLLVSRSDGGGLSGGGAGAGAGAAALAAAEAHLARAVADADVLARAEGGLMAGSNRACRQELEAGAEARRALAMLQCQAGRDADAAAHLRELEFSWRLGREVLCYPLGPPAAAAGKEDAAAAAAGGGEGCDGGERDGRAPKRQHVAAESGSGAAGAPWPPLAVLDGALPGPLLARLQAAFAPAAPFWRAHGYGPRQGYFSYMFPLVRRRREGEVQERDCLWSASSSCCSVHAMLRPQARPRAGRPRPGPPPARALARRRRCCLSSPRRCARSRCRTSQRWPRRATPSGGRTAAATALVRLGRATLGWQPLRCPLRCLLHTWAVGLLGWR